MEDKVYGLKFTFVPLQKAYCVNKSEAAQVPEHIVALMWWLFNKHSKGLEVGNMRTSKPDNLQHTEFADVEEVCIFRPKKKEFYIGVKMKE